MQKWTLSPKQWKKEGLHNQKCTWLLLPAVLSYRRGRKRKIYKWHEMVASCPTVCLSITQKVEQDKWNQETFWNKMVGMEENQSMRWVLPCAPCSCHHHLVLCSSVCLSCSFIEKTGEWLLNPRIHCLAHKTSFVVETDQEIKTAKSSCCTPTPPCHCGQQHYHCSWWLDSKLFHVSFLTRYYFKCYLWICQLILIITLRGKYHYIIFLLRRLRDKEV